ncbi:hypothetical protein ABK040_005092 [Willaertia magna]
MRNNHYASGSNNNNQNPNNSIPPKQQFHANKMYYYPPQGTSGSNVYNSSQPPNQQLYNNYNQQQFYPNPFQQQFTNSNTVYGNHFNPNNNVSNQNRPLSPSQNQQPQISMNGNNNNNSYINNNNNAAPNTTKQQKKSMIESLPNYVKDNHFFENTNPQYSQFILQKKSIPLLLFNDHIYDASIDNVRQLRQDEGLINPETGELDISYKEKDKIYLVKEAVLILRQLWKANQSANLEIGVCCIAGAMRTGKSLLSGLIVDDFTFSVFALGHEMKSYTKGIWMATQLIENGKGQKFILLDTEGLGSTETNNLRDDVIFLLSVLLSSLLTYNTVGYPKRGDLQSLSFVCNIAKNVATSDSSEKVENTIQNIKNYTPDFIWVFRDALLKVPSGYNSMEEYMEKEVLVSEESMFDNDKEKRNNTKRAIITFFPNRKYALAPPPSTSSEVLEEKIAKSIKNETSVKKFKNPTGGATVLTLESFPTIVSNFVMKINTPGLVPSFTDPVSLVAETTLRRCKQDALENYKLIMEYNVNENMPMELTQLMEIHNRICNTLCEEFRKKVVFVDPQSIQTEIEDLQHCFIKTEKNGQKGEIIIGGLIYPFYLQNNTKSKEFCFKILQQIYDKHVNLFKKEIQQRTMHDLDKLFEIVSKEYQSQAKGPEKETVLRSFLEERVTKDKQMLQQLKDYNEQFIQQKMQNQKLKEQEAKIKQEMETMKKNQESQKEFLKQIVEGQEKQMSTFIEELNKKSDADRKALNDMTQKMFQEQARMQEYQMRQMGQQQETMKSAINSMMENSKQQMQMMSNSISSLSSSISNMGSGGGFCTIL